MAKGKWEYRRAASGTGNHGIWCDDGTEGGRYLWMSTGSEFQIHMARLICGELNRVGVEMRMNGKFLLEVVARKPAKKAKG